MFPWACGMGRLAVLAAAAVEIPRYGRGSGLAGKLAGNHDTVCGKKWRVSCGLYSRLRAWCEGVVICKRWMARVETRVLSEWSW